MYLCSLLAFSVNEFKSLLPDKGRDTSILLYSYLYIYIHIYIYVMCVCVYGDRHCVLLSPHVTKKGFLVIALM